MNVIACPGVFDLFHSGHVRFFRRCCLYGRVVPILVTDEFAERYKRPTIMTLEERLESVKACMFVTDVYVNWGNEDSRRAILESGATHIAHGNDWTGDSLLEQLGISQEWLDEHNIQMLYVPYSHGISTSELIERCVARSERAGQV